MPSGSGPPFTEKVNLREKIRIIEQSLFRKMGEMGFTVKILRCRGLGTSPRAPTFTAGARTSCDHKQSHHLFMPISPIQTCFTSKMRFPASPAAALSQGGCAFFAFPLSLPWGSEYHTQKRFKKCQEVSFRRRPKRISETNHTANGGNLFFWFRRCRGQRRKIGGGERRGSLSAGEGMTIARVAL